MLYFFGAFLILFIGGMCALAVFVSLPSRILNRVQERIEGPLPEGENPPR